MAVKGPKVNVDKIIAKYEAQINKLKDANKELRTKLKETKDELKEAKDNFNKEKYKNRYLQSKVDSLEAEEEYVKMKFENENLKIEISKKINEVTTLRRQLKGVPTKGKSTTQLKEFKEFMR